jgi:two-component system cell cycle sensor histidine kinase/response regulator CckA
VETILVVDDTGLVLKVVVAILEAAHFHVLQADGGIKAVKMAAEYPGRIDLLLSDIKMPEMSGPRLGEILKQTRPDVRVMVMSGFSGDLLVLNYGWAFIAKPFLAKKLVEMVTDVLHSPDKSQGSNQFDKRKDNASE